MDKTFEQIVAEHDFALEKHFVHTKDGYILGVWRIPGKVGDATTGKPPIFFQHGILDSSDGWCMNTVDRALPFVLAE